MQARAVLTAYAMILITAAGACQLGSAKICVDGLPKTLQQLPRMLSLQLSSCLSTDDIVYVYDAVMSERQLVKTGEFVQIASDTSQVRVTIYTVL